jgi:hypothetical protein
MALGFAPCSELAIGIAGYELYKVQGVIRSTPLYNLTRRSSQLPLAQPQPLLINHNTLPNNSHSYYHNACRWMRLR